MSHKKHLLSSHHTITADHRNNNYVIVDVDLFRRQVKSMTIPNKKRIETVVFAIVVAVVTFTAHFHNFPRFLVRVPVNDHLVHQKSSSTSLSLSSTKTTTTTTTSSSGIMAVRSYGDYINEDYKTFVFATHPEHGILLLHCTRKKKKPPHFQVPGGHVDVEDFENAMLRTSDHDNDLLLQACKIGAARELFEETGIDVRASLDR